MDGPPDGEGVESLWIWFPFAMELGTRRLEDMGDMEEEDEGGSEWLVEVTGGWELRAKGLRLCMCCGCRDE